MSIGDAGNYMQVDRILPEHVGMEFSLLNENMWSLILFVGEKEIFYRHKTGSESCGNNNNGPWIVRPPKPKMLKPSEKLSSHRGNLWAFRVEEILDEIWEKINK